MPICRYCFAAALCLCLGGTPVRAATPAAPAPGGDFTLTDQNGRPYSLHDDRGRVVLMLFGYTHCPDVCPTTLATIRQVRRRLGERADSVRPLFISVDPARDTPAQLRAYAAYFDPDVVAATGTRAQLRDIAARYRTFFRYTGDTGSADYLVDHGSGLYVIDPQGRLAGIVPYGTPVDGIVELVGRLLDDAGS